MSPDYPLLGLLARKPSSGYSLGTWLKTEGQFLGRKPSMTPIYRSLKHFLELGWVEVEVDQRDAAPDAKVYRLTPAGRAALVAWAESDYVPAPRPMDPDFIVRLSFAGQLGPATALRIVRTELDYRRAQRAQEHPYGPVADLDPIPEIDRGWLTYIDSLTHHRGWQSTALFIGWLETVEADLSRQESRPDPAGELA